MEEEILKETVEIPEPVAEATEPEDKIAPYRAAAAQRAENAAIVAEHDTLLAEVMYELIMQDLDEE